MTGAFGWHLPIWWGTSLPDIGWLAFHSPYSFYYSRNDSGSSDAQKMRLKIGEKVFGHTKKGGAFRLHHNGNFCYSSFACFHFPLTGEMQLRTWTSRTRRWRFHFPLTGEMQLYHTLCKLFCALIPPFARTDFCSSSELCFFRAQK